MSDRPDWIEPDAASRERLYVLAEECFEVSKECAEIGQMAQKILRFGWDERYPLDTRDNRRRLEHEIGDLLALVDMMAEAGDLDLDGIEEGKRIKRQKLKTYISRQT